MNKIMKTVLLVEDEPVAAISKKRALTGKGYNVTSADTGEKAIEMMDNTDSIPDIILMDIELGAGIDGISAAEIIQKKHDIPVIFLTFHTGSEIIERFLLRFSYRTWIEWLNHMIEIRVWWVHLNPNLIRAQDRRT